MDYETLRQFADTWALLALTVLFIGIVIFVMRPSARRKYEDNANIPLKRD